VKAKKLLRQVNESADYKSDYTARVLNVYSSAVQVSSVPYALCGMEIKPEISVGNYSTTQQSAMLHRK
jgi:hypothetical protein